MILRWFSIHHHNKNRTAQSSAYLLHTSFRFLSRNHLDTTPLPVYYHPILSPYLATTLSLTSTLYTLHLPVFTFYFTPLFLLSNAALHSLEQNKVSPWFLFIFIGLTEPVFLFKSLSQSLFPLKNLHICKFCCTFATDSYAGGKYVLRKAFRKGSF